jgi:DDE superfamily endonuclease
MLLQTNKRFLGDAGYGNTEYVMAPYRGTRYHLKEQRQADQRPENSKELFNLCHSSLHNVIERIFGVLKRQWQILGRQGCEYSIDTQTDLFCALVRLYNFGRDCNEEETFEDESIEDEVIERQSDNIEVIHRIGNKWMEQKRDEIANRMWTDYQKYIQN